MSEVENLPSELDRATAGSALTSGSKQESPLLAWFLSGDKYLHENSLNGSHMGKGALLFLFEFVLNEFVFRYVPYTGLGALRYFLGHTLLLQLCVFVMLILTRRVLFGANRWKPDPAIGLPDRVRDRAAYQKVIPSYPENKWLLKRLAAYVDLQCILISDLNAGWALMFLVSIPYYLLQHAKVI